MGRPMKDGVDYWPFDVGFFTDKKIKMIKSQFGMKGVIIALMVLNSVYKDNGYFKKWDKDDCFLIAEEAGRGFDPEFVDRIVQVCVSRSLFDESVLREFGVLTSAGIQRRYLRMISNNRPDIMLIKEYWLLEEHEIPQGTLSRVTFRSIIRKENDVIRKENPVIRKENSQNKINKNKLNEKKIKEKDGTTSPVVVPEELQPEFQEYMGMRKQIRKPMTDYAISLAVKKLEDLAPGDFETQKMILNQSVLNSWQGLFPLDRPSASGKKTKKTTATTSKVDRVALSELENDVLFGG